MTSPEINGKTAASPATPPAEDHGPRPAVPSAVRPGARSELRQRIVSAAVMACAALVTAWMGDWVFAGFWMLVAVQAGREWHGIGGDPRRHVLVGLSALAAIGGGILAHREELALALGLVVLCMALAWFMATRARLISMIGVPYAAAIAIATVVVRDVPGAGIALILWAFGVVWATDTAAYFTGRRLRGPKLWPAISPNKTWSGFGGGLCAAMVTGLLLAVGATHVGVTWPFPLLTTALLAALCSMAGQGGDLAESALKRRYGVKDSARLIPGHGGVLDRLDAFVVAVTILAIAVWFR